MTITDPAASGQDVLAQVAGAEFSVQTDDAVAGADALILCTEWEQYNQLDPERIGGLVGERVIVDGRNALDPASWKRAGWTYRGIGRR